MKFTVTVIDFHPLQRNTLRGFATVHIDELKLTIHDVAVHQHDNGKRWIGLPAKPIIDRDGNPKRSIDGKIEYARLFAFDTRAVSDAFAGAVIKALLEYDETALGREGSLS